jgi:multiple sugar transport system substrate-binding protein
VPEVSVGLTPLQKRNLNYSRLDRLLFYAGLTVLIITLPLALRQGGVPPAPDEDKRILVFTQWWQDEMDSAVLPGLIHEFEAQNPGVQIELDTRSYHEVRRLLLLDSSEPDTAASITGQKESDSTGTETSGVPVKTAALPDIIGLDPRWIPALAAENLLEPVEIDPSQEGALLKMPDGVVQETAYEGRPMAQSLTSCMILLFYNTELLQKAGFERPPKNQAEFTAVARAVTDPSQDRYGFALALSPEDPLGVYRDVFPWLRASGVTLQRDGSPAFATTPVLDTVGFLNTLSREGILAPESFTKTGKDRLEEFIAGRLAMVFASAGDIRTLRAAQVPFGVTTIPGPASYIGKPVVGVTGWSIGIPRSSRYKDKAQAFLGFLAGKTNNIEPETGMAPVFGAVSGAGMISNEASIPNEPGTGSALKPDVLSLKIRDIYAAADTTAEYLDLPAEAALENILGEELRIMFEESRTPERTIRAVQERWLQALTPELRRAK